MWSERSERKPVVAVVYGGANTEHEVSLRSARDAIATLRERGHAVRPIGIGRDGSWHAAEVDELAAARAAGDTARGPRAELWDGVDVVLPLVHGRHGEDGALQGAIELAGLPYAGSGVLASALAMDKLMTGRVAAAAGVAVPRTERVTRADLPALDRLAASLPLFVKPNRAGSSVGAGRAETPEQLASAVRSALEHDTSALVQEVVDGVEAGVGVYETVEGEAVVTGPSRVRLTEGTAFFDYDAKYGPARSRIEVPGAFPPGVAARLREDARTVFRAIGAEGFARVDFFVTAEGEVVLVEVNTVPGLGAESHLPRLCAEAGLPYPELLGTLIARALETGPR